MNKLKSIFRRNSYTMEVESHFVTKFLIILTISSLFVSALVIKLSKNDVLVAEFKYQSVLRVLKHKISDLEKNQLEIESLNRRISEIRT